MEKVKQQYLPCIPTHLAGAESEVETSRVGHIMVQSWCLYSILTSNQFQTQQMSVYCLTRYSLKCIFVKLYQYTFNISLIVSTLLTSSVYLEWAATAFVRRLAFSSACNHIHTHEMYIFV